jgi:hypothetical protein
MKRNTAGLAAAVCWLAVCGNSACKRPFQASLDKVKPPLREPFRTALAGELPDVVSANTAVQVEVEKTDTLPAALTGSHVRIVERGDKLVAAEGLLARDWRALVEDASVRSIDAFRINRPPPSVPTGDRNLPPRMRRIEGEPVKREDMATGDRNLPPRMRNRIPGLDAALTGRGLYVALIDEQFADARHPEFAIPGGSRVTAPSQPLTMHATEMASIIGARGLAPRGNQEVDTGAKGVAPDVNIISYDSGSDIAALMRAAVRARVSNHSYGPRAGWEWMGDGGWRWYGEDTATLDASFGKYKDAQRTLDVFLHDHPQHLAFAAAGNELRDAGPCPRNPVPACPAYVVRVNNVWRSSTRWRPGDGAGGADTVTGPCLAKNTICVTAVEDRGGGYVPLYHNSTGPADDGRIKPDLAAEGYNIPAATGLYGSTPLWGTSTGTSPASALASGVGVLLTEKYAAVNGGGRPIASEIKAALIHTAIREGPPNLVTGWGVIDAGAAGRAIAGLDRVRIVRESIGQQAVGHAIQFTGGKVKVTLVWNDPPGDVNGGGLNDDRRSLKHNLDLSLVGPLGVLRPYRYDLVRREIKQDGPNDSDNVEVIELAGPLNGQWHLIVSANGLAGRQEYALAIEGIRLLN